MAKKQTDAEQDSPFAEQPFVAHLLELRDRLLRAVIAVGLVFLGIFPFANDLYVVVAEPLMAHLPEGTSMIATEVASPFLTPFKLSLMASILVALPFLLYQLWAFVAPGLYKHEQRMVLPLVASSTILFYVGMLFAYFVVFPLVFAFLVGAAPEGVTVATDIAKYLDFIITLFFAFGLAFEVPIATILLVWMGATTPDALVQKRPYIVVGAFVIGMFLTPPDVISQTLLALPMLVLFELGIILSRIFLRQKEKAEAARDAEGSQEPPPPPPPPSGGAPRPATQTAGAAGFGAGVPGEPSPFDDQGRLDSSRFVALTEDEMDAELDRAEAEETGQGPRQEDQKPKGEHNDDQGPADDEPEHELDPVDAKLRRIQALREEGKETEARLVLYEVLAEGNDNQIFVARNILAQLDS